MSIFRAINKNQLTTFLLLNTKNNQQITNKLPNKNLIGLHNILFTIKKSWLHYTAVKRDL